MGNRRKRNVAISRLTHGLAGRQQPSLGFVGNWFGIANAKIKAGFIEPMLLQRTEKLSEGGV
jgi:hypothetical protein